MSQSVRIARIHQLLEVYGSVRLKDLMNTFEVSRITIQRDIALMRDRLGTPLIYDYKANVYRLQPMGQVGEKVEHFPGMWLSTDEAYAVLTMYNVMKLIDPGVLMRFMQPLRFPI
jgi:predicted DNA-binding transcriptional regulator YafY